MAGKSEDVQNSPAAAKKRKRDKTEEEQGSRKRYRARSRAQGQGETKHELPSPPPPEMPSIMVATLQPERHSPAGSGEASEFESKSTWSLLEPMGGRMLDIDPIFTNDEA
jgi:NET1-associated nuclear protein 1 (U3 small nucleolar RNA-associated protein 17)